MPLIAWAYIAFAGGLIAWYSGVVWFPIVEGAIVLLIVLARTSTVSIGIAIIFVAGLVVARAVPKPPAFGSRVVKTAPTPDTSWFLHQQHRASRAIETVFRTDAPMAKALLIADQSEIPYEIKQRYSRAGLIHMLSISGLHVSIVAGAVELMLHVIRLPLQWAAAISLGVLTVYVSIIGFPPPAVRAGVMVGVALAARMLQRPTDKWAALAVGAFVPLFDPPTVLNLGYQLSVGGIAGLIASGAFMQRVVPRTIAGWRRTLLRGIVASAMATAVTAPLVAWTFGQISLIGPIANIFADPVIGILQPILFLALLLAPVPSLAQFVADAAHLPLVIFDAIATHCANIPYAAIHVIPTLTSATLAGIASVAMVIACVTRATGKGTILALTAICIMIWIQ